MIPSRSLGQRMEGHLARGLGQLRYWLVEPSWVLLLIFELFKEFQVPPFSLHSCFLTGVMGRVLERGIELLICPYSNFQMAGGWNSDSGKYADKHYTSSRTMLIGLNILRRRRRRGDHFRIIGVTRKGPTQEEGKKWEMIGKVLSIFFLIHIFPLLP